MYHTTTLKGHQKRLTTAIFTLAYPLKGSLYSLVDRLSSIMSSFSWFLMYSFTVSVFNPTVDTKYPFAQKFLLPYLYFKFACFSKIINDDFPFKYPMKFDTAILGGIFTSIWMWSLHACASTISTPLYLHSCLIIFPMSNLNLPYISFLLYFGINTIWYLQFQRVCYKLESSLVFRAIDITLLMFCFRLPTNYIISWGLFL